MPVSNERLDAYEWYLRALSHFYALNRENLDKAIMLLDRAFAIEPHISCARWQSPGNADPARSWSRAGSD
jgi:hypothetical protein